MSSEVTLLDGLTTLRSIRRYHLDEDVPREVVNQILFLATRAPNPGNAQSWRFLVLEREAQEARGILGMAHREGWAQMRVDYGFADLVGPADGKKAKVARAMDSFVRDFERAPVIILACVSGITEKSYLGGAPAIYPACQNLLLAARQLGYGGVLTTWHRRREAELRSALQIPDDAMLAATIPLGSTTWILRPGTAPTAQQGRLRERVGRHPRMGPGPANRRVIDGNRAAQSPDRTLDGR